MLASKKNILKCFLLLVLLLSINLEAQLILEVSTDKEQYEYGETIHIKSSLTNISDTTVKYWSPTYGSCDAQFELNDYQSWNWTSCLLTYREIVIPPKKVMNYYWTIDPKVFGLPSKEGEQMIIADHIYNELKDTTYFYAPEYFGGQLYVIFPEHNDSLISLVKDSLSIELLDRELYDERYHEFWQVAGYNLDSLYKDLSSDPRFEHIEMQRFIMYDSTNVTAVNQNDASDFYPLHVGDKWWYINLLYEVGTTPDTTYYTKEIIGDTLMPNGKTYFIVEEWDNIHFERYDSSSNEIKYYENGGCGGIDDSRYSLAFDPDSTVFWERCGEIPYYITYDDTSKGKDSSSIILESDYLVSERTVFRKHLGLFSQSFTEISYSVSSLVGAKINGNTWGTITSVNDDQNELPNSFTVEQNYPNPFNPETNITYHLPAGKNSYNVVIKIYDTLGRLIKVLVNEEQSSGTYSVKWNGTDMSGNQVSSGIYIYSVHADHLRVNKKMVLMR